MPDAAFAINQEVERSVNEVWHKGRRNNRITRRTETFPGRERPERDGHKVIFVPGPKERARANHQRIVHDIQNFALGFRLAATVNVERRDFTALDIRSWRFSIEDEVG